MNTGTEPNESDTDDVTEIETVIVTDGMTVDNVNFITNDYTLTEYASEGVGFEPTRPVRAHWFSRPAPSSARPSLLDFTKLPNPYY